MRANARISVVIPAMNEERSIGKVLDAIPSWVDEVVVADNGSTDQTAAVAAAHGARVASEPRRGYGQACLTGIAAVSKPDIIVFLDADFSDHPDEMDRLVDPILRDEVDMVIGSRIRGTCERGALTPQARFGNWLSCALIRFFWGVRFSDLGPFRAIRFSTLRRLDMRDTNFGWTVEMQVKAATRGVRSAEVPISYRRRIGVSKISGTVRGVILAGTKILYTIMRAALQPSRYRAMSAREKLCVFTRYPEAGTTKTRLIPALGPDCAAHLQRAMTAHVLCAAADVAHIRKACVEVRYEGGDEARMRASFGDAFRYRRQGDGDLGARMERCAHEALASGAESIVIVGADIPGIDANILTEAFSALRSHDLVIGPVADGGYYLIGLRREVPELFADMPWGTEQVFRRTMDTAEGLGMAVSRLPELADVDRPEDIELLERNWGKEQLAEALGTITIIIPTLNEVDGLDATLKPLLGAPPVGEVIVVDAGSVDGTAEKARACGVKVLLSEPGRAKQMNTGAEAATGSILLFLHADTHLPENFAALVRSMLSTSGVAAGAFQFRLDANGRAYRILESLVNWRSRVLQMPYGDQCLFMKTRTFRELGGFPDIPIMEDFEMVRRLRHHGRISIVHASAVTSARRWEARGLLRTTLINQSIVAAYYLGVCPHRLTAWYRRTP